MEEIFTYVTGAVSGGIRTDTITVIMAMLGLGLILCAWRYIRQLFNRDDTEEDYLYGRDRDNY